jgi:hypothetical protein
VSFFLAIFSGDGDGLTWAFVSRALRTLDAITLTDYRIGKLPCGRKEAEDGRDSFWSV